MADVYQGIYGTGARSQLVRAFRQLADSAGEAPAVSGMYGQIRKVTINGSLVLSSENGYDIDFDIPFDDDAEINESSVILYNLAKNTEAQIKKDVSVIVEAGYQKDSSGQILNGKAAAVKTYWDDTDRITEITVKDYNGAADTELEDISYTKNTAASQILRDLAGRLKIPVATFQIKRDYTFKSAVKVNGSLIDAIRKYAKVCGVHAWIHKSSLYVCALDVPVSEGYFDLKPENGLLSVETWQESETNEEYEDVTDGITAKMLLQHRIYTGCTLLVTSKNVNGRFKVREGEHTADGDEFITTVKAVRMG